MEQGAETIVIAPVSVPLPCGSLAPDDYAVICQVIAAYGRLYDEGLMEGFAKLLAEDSTYLPNRPGVLPETMRGRDAIVDFFAHARADCRRRGVQPRHFTSNIVISAVANGSVDASASMSYAETSGSGEVTVQKFGAYSFRLTKRDAIWRILTWSRHYDS